jgi:hypothetical protein
MISAMSRTGLFMHSFDLAVWLKPESACLCLC